jgi:hypothetical protein
VAVAVEVKVPLVVHCRGIGGRRQCVQLQTPCLCWHRNLGILHNQGCTDRYLRSARVPVGTTPLTASAAFSLSLQAEKKGGQCGQHSNAVSHTEHRSCCECTDVKAGRTWIKQQNNAQIALPAGSGDSKQGNQAQEEQGLGSSHSDWVAHR